MERLVHQVAQIAPGPRPARGRGGFPAAGGVHPGERRPAASVGRLRHPALPSDETTGKCRVPRSGPGALSNAPVDEATGNLGAARSAVAGATTPDRSVDKTAGNRRGAGLGGGPTLLDHRRGRRAHLLVGRLPR